MTALLGSCKNQKNQEAAKKAADWAISQVGDGDVTAHLTLPTKYAENDKVKLTWTSDKTDVISNAGQYTAPNEDTDVKLTVKAEYKGATATREKTVKAKASSLLNQGLNGLNQGLNNGTNGLNQGLNNGTNSLNLGVNNGMNNGTNGLNQGLNNSMNNGTNGLNQGLNNGMNNGTNSLNQGMNNGTNGGTNRGFNGLNQGYNNGTSGYNNGTNSGTNGLNQGMNNGTNGYNQGYNNGTSGYNGGTSRGGRRNSGVGRTYGQIGALDEEVGRGEFRDDADGDGLPDGREVRPMPFRRKKGFFGNGANRNNTPPAPTPTETTSIA
jgi:hypothetical protein